MMTFAFDEKVYEEARRARTKEASIQKTERESINGSLFLLAKTRIPITAGMPDRAIARVKTPPHTPAVRSAITEPIRTRFKSVRVLGSPIIMGNVLVPTIRSPCMARISKKAVLTKTSPRAQEKTRTD